MRQPVSARTISGAIDSRSACVNFTRSGVIGAALRVYVAARCLAATTFWRCSTDGRMRSRTSLGRTPIQTIRTTRTAAAMNSLGRMSVSLRFSSWANGFQKTRCTSVSM